MEDYGMCVCESHLYLTRYVLCTVCVGVSRTLDSCDTVCMVNINTVSNCLLGKYPLSIVEDLNAEGQMKDNCALSCPLHLTFPMPMPRSRLTTIDHMVHGN